jgi:DNA gyrase subunit A
MDTQREDEVIQIDFSEEMKNSYRDYAISVIIARALPDVRDGLKPVQRRVLYAMNELGLDPKKPHRKSARIVGDTMGKYHPHGDSSIYEALMHMSEGYTLSLPLVDGHGNCGSIDGDPPAAMRYTEARLSSGAMTLLENLDKGLVDFMPNFDDSEQEPTVLPATLPNLLINGTTGIAVGMATNIPPHNTGEVIEGVIAYMDKPSITTEELMKYIPGPDFPTGGIITNGDALKAVYETGEGKIRCRAATSLEKGDAGRTNIVVSEIPYTSSGQKSRLVESLVGLMRDKAFDEIYDVRDESSKEGIRIVIEVKKDRDAENLLNGLFRKSPLEDTYGVNMLAVKEQQPMTLSLKSLIAEFVAFQEDIYTKEYTYKLDKANKRLEIVDGLIRATDIIDLIIEILRGSTSMAQAKACLCHGDTTAIRFRNPESALPASQLDFTEAQADAILSMQLSRLIGLEIMKLHEEEQKLKDTVADCSRVLGSEKELHKAIKERLRNYKKQFAVPRRTQIINAETASYVEEFVEETLVVLVDKFGYTKTVDEAAYTKATPEALAEYTHVVKLKNTDKFCAFTAQGNLYQLKAGTLPRCKIKDKGTLIHALCKTKNEEFIFYTSFEELFDSMLLFSTKHGYVKQVSGAEFETGRTVVNTTKLEEKDSIVSICRLGVAEVIGEDTRVIMLTQKKLVLAYPLSDVPELKKVSRGVKGITLDQGDSVLDVAVASPAAEIVTLHSKNYMVKKIKLKRRTGKAGKINA